MHVSFDQTRTARADVIIDAGEGYHAFHSICLARIVL